MDNCPVCNSNKIITKISKTGEETFCSSCRRVIVSATLGFNFTANSDEPEECKGPGNDPRPGYKGPGEKAHCYTYDPGDEESRKRAYGKAKESVYSYEHRKAASKIVNGLAYFEGAPSFASAGSGSSPDFASAARELKSTGVVPPPPALDTNGVVPSTTSEGTQISELNGRDPLNSGTTAHKKIAELVKELTGDPTDVRSYMGPSFCTKCNDTHPVGQCNQPDEML